MIPKFGILHKLYSSDFSANKLLVLEGKSSRGEDYF
jgi:hypothetical protein